MPPPQGEGHPYKIAMDSEVRINETPKLGIHVQRIVFNQC